MAKDYPQELDEWADAAVQELQDYADSAEECGTPIATTVEIIERLDDIRRRLEM